MNLFIDKSNDKNIFKDFIHEIGVRIKNMNNRVEGETYIIDEVGDDAKYVFLTRESDNLEFQEFNISDELYNQILNDINIEKLKFENGNYKIVK